MRKWFMLGLVLGLLIAVAIPASALTIWYGGDPDFQGNLASQQGGYFNGAMTYDDFDTTMSGWNVYYLIGNFGMNFTTDKEYYEIRSGVSNGNGGTLVKSGTIDVTQTWTGDMMQGRKVYTLAGNTPAFELAPGKYWVGLAPIVPDPANTSAMSFVEITSGDGGLGTPLNNGNSFFTFDREGHYFSGTSVYFGSNKDFSYGVFANPVVPEPGSMLAFGMGLVSFVPFLRRRK